MPRALIHTMLRILDEQRSLAFYRALGFEETSRKRVGGDTATVIFLALPGDGERLELTLNDGRTEPYELGEAYGHIALSVDDMDAELADLATRGITPEKPPIMNIQIKPRANIIGVRVEIWPPQRVPTQLKIFTPVGTAIAMVAREKAAVAMVPRPVVNMWWDHTPKPRKPITAPENTTMG
jgi:lactoylglutathione lyase